MSDPKKPEPWPTPKRGIQLTDLDQLDKLYAAASKGEWFADNVEVRPERTAYAKLSVGVDGGNKDLIICDTQNADAVEIRHGDDEGPAYHDDQGMNNLRWMAVVHNEFPVLRDELRMLWKYQDHVSLCVEKLQQALDEVSPRSTEIAGVTFEYSLDMRVAGLVLELLVSRRQMELQARDIALMQARTTVLSKGSRYYETMLQKLGREHAELKQNFVAAQLERDAAKGLAERLMNELKRDRQLGDALEADCLKILGHS